jgi:glycosyl transferase, family 25
MDRNGETSMPADSFDKTFQCHVISLRKTPKKAADFFERAKPTRLNFNLFEGIDGAVLSDDEAVRSGIVARNTNGYTRGMIGCAASHLALWKQCGSGERNFIIFEDDAFIRHDFKEQVEALISNRHDWDIVLFGFNTDSLLDIQMAQHCRFAGVFSCPFPSADQLASFVRETDELRLYRLHNAFGGCGYGISPRGARKFMQVVFPLDNRPVFIPYWKNTLGSDTFVCRTRDMVMNCYYSQFSSYVCFPPLVLSPNDPQQSSTVR